MKDQVQESLAEEETCAKEYREIVYTCRANCVRMVSKVNKGLGREYYSLPS